MAWISCTYVLTVGSDKSQLTNLVSMQEGARRMLQHISPSPRQISTPDPASQVIEGGYNINEATPPPPGRQ